MSSFPDAEKLARVLSERGLRSRWAVRVGVHPMRLHGARAALMAMTGLDEREARRVLEQRELVFEGVPFTEAQRRALELQGAGALTWVEHAISERFAHTTTTGPHRSAARDEPCEWLSLLGRTLILARGRPWNWGPSEVLVAQGRSAELGRAIDEQRQRWAEAGLIEVEHEHELLAGISPVHPPFEDAIRSASEAEIDELATVYADWLQDQGDPRGQLGSAVLHESPERVEQLLTEHAHHILGPLGNHLWPGLRWRGPLILEAHLPPPPALDHPHRPELDPFLDAVTLVDIALTLPAMSQLRRLKLGSDYTFVGDALPRAPCRLSLRELTLTGLPPRSTRPLELPALPRVERVELAVVSYGLVLAPMPELRSMSIFTRELNMGLAECFATLDAPKLRDFSLRFFRANNVDPRAGLLIDQLRELFALPTFAGLQTLAFRHPRVEADLIHMFRTLPFRASLERLDLRGSRAAGPQVSEAVRRLRSELPHVEIQA